MNCVIRDGKREKLFLDTVSKSYSGMKVLSESHKCQHLNSSIPQIHHA